MDGSHFEVDAVELICFDFEFIVGHFADIEELSPQIRSVVEGGISDAEVAEDLLLLRL